jgi:hypothetical protein
MKMHEAEVRLCKLLPLGVRRLSSSNQKLMGAYQHQPIGTRVHLDVLCDVPIWHPRTHDVERKRCLRNVDNREYIGMGNMLALTMDDLV